jgi:hypothetical protein
MVQPLGNPNDLSTEPHNFFTDFDHHLVLFPTRSAAHVLAELPAQSDGRPVQAGLPVAIKSSVVRQVVVLEVAGRLAGVVEALDRAIQLALAEGPRGVVCDLSAVLDSAEPDAVEVLAKAGRHVREWPGTSVAVACPDPRVRKALAAHPLGCHLILATSLLTALSEVPATLTPAVEWLRLAPHPTAPRESQDFVTRTLQDWGLGSAALSAGLVMRELVANSMHTGTDIDLSVAWDQGALRLTVRDNSPDQPQQPYNHLDSHARRLSVVAVLSRAFGVLPTADGGKVVWAVLDAPGNRPPTSATC